MANSRLLGRKPGEKINGKLKCAVFGTGYWSTLQIPAWYETNEVDIVGLYNRTYEKGLNMAQRFNVPKVYRDAEEFMTSEDFDFADIITEVPGHEWLTLLAAKHKIPTICQKPMSDTLESCKKMVNACKVADVPYFIHENFRWQRPFRAVKKLIDEGRVGKLVSGKIQLFTGGQLSFEVQPFLAQIEYPALTDMGPHVLDLCRFLFGEIKSVCTQTVKTIDNIKGDDTAVILADADGIPVICEICRFSQGVYVEGLNGTIILDSDNKITVKTFDGNVEVIDVSYVPRYSFTSDQDWGLQGGYCIDSIVQCNQSFADAFREGTLPETNGEDNYKSIRAVFAAIRSLQEDRKVHISEME